MPDDTVCTLTEVSSAAEATALASALDLSALTDMFSAVDCIALADAISVSSAERTVSSKVATRVSILEARSAFVIRSFSCSALSVRDWIMLSRNTSSERAMSATSSWLRLAATSASRSPSASRFITACRFAMRRRMLLPT